MGWRLFKDVASANVSLNYNGRIVNVLKFLDGGSGCLHIELLGFPDNLMSKSYGTIYSWNSYY